MAIFVTVSPFEQSLTWSMESVLASGAACGGRMPVAKSVKPCLRRGLGRDLIEPDIETVYTMANLCMGLDKKPMIVAILLEARLDGFRVGPIELFPTQHGVIFKNTG